jgi:putative flippase GtrA
MASLTRTIGQHSAVRFLFVGALSYAVDIGTLVAVHRLFGASVVASTAIAYGVAMFVNFKLNRDFAFRRAGLLRPAFVRYMTLVAANFVATVAGVAGLTAIGVNYIVAKTTLVAILAVTNYVAFELWIFSAPPGRHAVRQRPGAS